LDFRERRPVSTHALRSAPRPAVVAFVEERIVDLIADAGEDGVATLRLLSEFEGVDPGIVAEALASLVQANRIEANFGEMAYHCLPHRRPARPV
jgi:hypothetical protein